ncbi:hypothetical protein [Frigidibacter sp.]|uniref:hypothetical protein n=1 Tax=Frigidibacter sp. TaxID=2586418 RepID=UPI002734F173|nr:hypothetical protein [Frigidibacter sp.]MDP3341496.1 hypothetical protein [Frigidibacter sp.]
MRYADFFPILAEFRNVPEFVIQNQLKNPAFRVHIPGTPGPHINSPHDYERRDMIRAAILLNSADHGFTTPEMSCFAAALDDYPTTFGGGPEYVDISGLDAIIRGAEVGDAWEIVVALDAVTPLRRSLRVHVTWAGWLDDPNSYAVQLRGKLGTLRIPASRLIAPLLPV